MAARPTMLAKSGTTVSALYVKADRNATPAPYLNLAAMHAL